MGQEGRAHGMAVPLETERPFAALRETRDEAALIAQGDGRDGRRGACVRHDELGGDDAEGMGVSETEEEQGLRTDDADGVLLGPEHGELLGRGRRLEPLGQGGRGRRDGRHVGITFGRDGGQGDAGPARPGGTEVGGEVGRALEAGGADAQRTDEVGGNVTKVGGLLMQTADGGVEAAGGAAAAISTAKSTGFSLSATRWAATRRKRAKEGATCWTC